MKQQLLEKALENMMESVLIARSHLELYGRYNDADSIMKSAMSNLDRALEYYDETKKLSTPTFPGREVQEG